MVIKRTITPVSIYQVLALLFGGYGLINLIGNHALKRYVAYSYANELGKRMYMYSRKRKMSSMQDPTGA